MTPVGFRVHYCVTPLYGHPLDMKFRRNRDLSRTVEDSDGKASKAVRLIS